MKEFNADTKILKINWRFWLVVPAISGMLSEGVLIANLAHGVDIGLIYATLPPVLGVLLMLMLFVLGHRKEKAAYTCEDMADLGEIESLMHDIEKEVETRNLEKEIGGSPCFRALTDQ